MIVYSTVICVLLLTSKKPHPKSKIRELVLSIEKQVPQVIDYKDENTDVIVELESGKKYIATFFTYNNILKLEKEHRQTGEFLYGQYFWMTNMVLIDNCSKESMRICCQ